MPTRIRRLWPGARNSYGWLTAVACAASPPSVGQVPHPTLSFTTTAVTAMRRDNERARPIGTDSELSTDQGSSSLELYYDDLERRASLDATRCTVCGHADGNLSRPFGRCWACITGESPDDQRPRFLREFRPHPRATSVGTAPLTMTTGDVGGRLAGILTHLNGAHVGVRNATLYWAACRVGEMIAARQLHADSARVADVLVERGVRLGLTTRESIATVRSGFRASGVPT